MNYSWSRSGDLGGCGRTKCPIKTIGLICQR